MQLSIDELFIFGNIIKDMLTLRLEKNSWGRDRLQGQLTIDQLAEGTCRVCDPCRVFFRRYVGRCLDSGTVPNTQSKPVTFFKRVLLWLDYEVSGPGRIGAFKILTDVYNLYQSVVHIAWQCQTGAKGTKTIMAYRTFKDAVIASSRFSVVTETMMPDGRRGACVSSERTLRHMLAVGLKHHKRDKEQPLSPDELYSDLRTLAKRYKELGLTKNTTRQPSFDWVEEIKFIPARLWTFWFGFLSPRRLRNDRKQLLQQHDGDVSSLPFPHSNSCQLSTNMLNALSQHDYRRVIRVLVAIQAATFTLDPKAVGLTVWSFSCTLAAKGGNMLLRLCNAAGFSVHPNTFRHLKESLVAHRRTLPLSELIQSGVFSAFAFDNIDAELAVNAIADGSRLKQFHGTALIAEQAPGLPPIASRFRYTPLPESVLHPADMLGLNEYDVKAVRDSKAFLLGVVACHSKVKMTKSIK